MGLRIRTEKSRIRNQPLCKSGSSLFWNINVNHWTRTKRLTWHKKYIFSLSLSLFLSVSLSVSLSSWYNLEFLPIQNGKLLFWNRNFFFWFYFDILLFTMVLILDGRFERVARYRQFELLKAFDNLDRVVKVKIFL